MLRIVVRSKRDADAVKAMLNILYPEWNVDVFTMHGARSLDAMIKELEPYLSDDKFITILLGREDEKIVRELENILPINAAVHVVPKAKVRNARIEEIAHHLELCKSKIRLRVKWKDKENIYTLGKDGIELENYEYHPAYDIFLGFGFREVLKRALNIDVNDYPLIVRKFEGIHEVYVGFRRAVLLKIPDIGCSFKGRIVNEDLDHYNIDLDKLIRNNITYLQIFEKISINFLKQFKDYDTIVIPWSGGKDSTAVLLMALKVFPKDKLRIIYSDTGLEFSQTSKYINELAKRFKIEVIREYAGIDKELLNGKPLPTHDYRWCTGLKLEALRRGIRKYSSGKVLILTGDRDVESEKRAKRPLIRKDNEIEATVATPIKFWCTLHVQLYLLAHNVKLNPLYYHGFYRIGCYICPALRSWELYIMLNDEKVRRELESKFFFKEFINHRC